jgi:hypothetical protein
MILLRLLALGFLTLAAVAAGVDLWSSVAQDGAPRLAALGEWWAWAHRDSLLLLQPAIERHISPALWDPGIQTLLEWPAAADLAALGGLLWLAARFWRRPGARLAARR